MRLPTSTLSQLRLSYQSDEHVAVVPTPGFRGPSTAHPIRPRPQSFDLRVTSRLRRQPSHHLPNSLIPSVRSVEPFLRVFPIHDALLAEEELFPAFFLIYTMEDLRHLLSTLARVEQPMVFPIASNLSG